jgi:hypothetical protein
MPIITVDVNGSTVRFIYSDDLRPLLKEGQQKIRRVSHVEPNPDGQWTADLSPCGGPLLGPFVTRQEALDAEVAYLNTNVL